MNNIDSLIDFYKKNTNFDYRNGYIDYDFFDDDEGVKFYYKHAYSSNIDDGLDNFYFKHKEDLDKLIHCSALSHPLKELLNKEVKDLTEEELFYLKELKDFLECEIETGNGFELLKREEVFYDCDNLSLEELEEQKEILESLIKEHNSYVENEKDYCFYIDKIKDKIEAYELETVKINGLLIEYIENPSEQVQLEAVKEDGYAIKHIFNPSEAVQLEAVKQNGDAIKYINNPTEQVELEAVKEDGEAIKHIFNPSEEVQIEAVKQNHNAIEWIDKPSEQVQLAAVKNCGMAIVYIKNPSEQVQLEAVREDYNAIQYIENPTEKVKQETEEVKKKKNVGYGNKAKNDFKDFCKKIASNSTEAAEETKNQNTNSYNSYNSYRR